MKPMLRIVSTALILAFLNQGTLADTVWLDDGSVLECQIHGKEAEYLLVEVANRGETALRRLRPDQVDRIEFSDTSELLASDQDPVKRLARLERAAARRAPLLGLLDEPDERALVLLLESYLAAGDSLQALANAKLWQGRFRSEEIAASVATICMRAASASGAPEEAALHAQAWIDSGADARTSALAWAILAEARLEAGDAQAALWISAQPIAFAPDPAPKDLARCYAIAIAAASALGRSDYADTLRAEMAERGFAAPDPAPAPAQRAQPLFVDDGRPLDSLLQLHGNP